MKIRNQIFISNSWNNRTLCRVFTLILLAGVEGFSKGHAGTAGSVDPQAQALVNWGLDTYEQILEDLQVEGSALFAETASMSGQQSGGNGGFAYVWPLSTQFRVQNSLARIDPATYVPMLREFSDEAHSRYWNEATGGYRSGVGRGATLFYDDNAHMAVALMEAYRITGDSIYLSRARETYAFVISGESPAGGGGIYFNVVDFNVKETISTLQGARSALMLYRVTGEESYLEDALRLYEWAESHVQQSDGLFLERYYLTGPNAGTAGDFTLVNGAGDAISVNLEFYAATGDAAYLEESQRIAERSLIRFFDARGNAINDEGYWAFELVDALVDLSEADGDPQWTNRAVRALEWLYNYRRDPNDRYGTLWARGGIQRDPLTSWDLNDQAPVARSYLHAGLAIIQMPEELELQLTLMDSDGAFKFLIQGPSGASGQIQRSQDLKTWEDWTPFDLGDAPLEFTDPDSISEATFFYRTIPWR